MFRLAGKLAISNLVKNRALYYPFALATCLAVAISYLFNSLTFNPHLDNVYGADTVKMVLMLGMIIVTIAATIIVLYANSFVMKNRSKELGLYGMLGMTKRHLFVMTLFELFVFGLLTILVGLGIGILFDQLLYAFLLKLMQVKVTLVSTFQLPVVLSVFVIYTLIFGLLVFTNGVRLARFNPLQLSKEKSSGEKKGRFLGLQTALGLLFLGAGYAIALSVNNPMAALVIFFLAVLLVIIGTYLLFNAGTTVFLQLLQKNKRYYYQPKNMISVSNLIFRMKKNAVGLATIAILSTMVLVTLVGAVNLYAGNEYFQTLQNPHDFSLNGRDVSKEQMSQIFDEFTDEEHLTVKGKYTYDYGAIAAREQIGNHFILYQAEERNVIPQTVIAILSTQDYQMMTGKNLTLKENEVAYYSEYVTLDKGQDLQLGEQNLILKEEIKENFTKGNLPDNFSAIVPRILYLITPNPEAIYAQQTGANLQHVLYGGLDIKASESEKRRLSSDYQDKLTQANQEYSQAGLTSGVYGASKVEAVDAMNALFGGLFFIGFFLAIVFMIGTVLVIYYKQISEGYEDRERFVILQKVGLDEKQTKQTIRKQVITVFFLPLLFAFVHVAFAYHMLSLILRVLGVHDPNLMLMITLLICGTFLAVYIAVFLLTSRSYRRIVSR